LSNNLVKTRGILIAVLLIVTTLTAQDQKVADSLVTIYKKGGATAAIQLELLRNLAFNELNDLSLSIKYANELIALSKKRKTHLYLFRGII